MKTSPRLSLQLEALEARDCPSVSTPRKVMVITDGVPNYSQTTVHSLTEMQQQNRFSGTGILKSQDGGKTWEKTQEIKPASYSLTLSGIGNGDQAFSDYGQWRQRFGTGI